jgi:hypothetical protein
MDELSQIVQNFINNEKKILIQRICNNEPSLISKTQELLEKYVENDISQINTHINKKLKISSDFENMDFLNNEMIVDESGSNIDMEDDSENTTLNIKDPEIEIDIESLNHKLEKMTLKDIQKICEQKSIDILKTSPKSGKTIKKSKGELVKLLISNQ